MYTNKKKSPVKPVNPLILRAILSINEVDTTNFNDDEIQFTPELAERFGESRQWSFEITIMDSTNKNKLETPTTIQKAKHDIKNQKRLQR